MASSTTATATEPLWGSTPIKTFMSAHAPPFWSDLRHRLARRTFRLRAVLPIPLLSHSACRVLYGGTQAENKPTHPMGDRKLASDPCITGTLKA